MWFHWCSVPSIPPSDANKFEIYVSSPELTTLSSLLSFLSLIPPPPSHYPQQTPKNKHLWNKIWSSSPEPTLPPMFQGTTIHEVDQIRDVCVICNSSLCSAHPHLNIKRGTSPVYTVSCTLPKSLHFIPLPWSLPSFDQAPPTPSFAHSGYCSAPEMVFLPPGWHPFHLLSLQ